jgi:hypothetical protein
MEAQDIKPKPLMEELKMNPPTYLKIISPAHPDKRPMIDPVTVKWDLTAIPGHWEVPSEEDQQDFAKELDFSWGHWTHMLQPDTPETPKEDRL